MKRKVFLVGFALFIALAPQAPSGLLRGAKVDAKVAAASPAQVISTDDGKVAAVVELESEPVIPHQRRLERIPRREVDFESDSARAYEAQLEEEHASFKSRLALLSPNLRVRTELRKVANAVSVEVSQAELDSIAAIPGVKRVEIVRERHATLDTSVPLINAPALWNRLGGVGAAGQGIKIAVLDTGIDITNSLFSDSGYSLPSGFPKTNNGSLSLTNKKVIAAKSFLQGGGTALDENGHGSNCAGIAGGGVTASPIGMISGVAPRAYLGNYRVLNAAGSGFTDLIAQGIEAAVADGFDVLSLSFGGPADTAALGIDGRACEAAVAAGAVVVVAAGNAGDGDMTIDSPAIAPSVISVAASSNSHIVGPGIRVEQPSPVPSSLVSIVSSNGDTVTLDASLKSLPYTYVDPQGRGCGTLQAGSLSGKIALIERGVCSFSSKVNKADLAGARAVIIFNKDISEGTDGGDTFLNMTVPGTRIPSVFVTRTSGLALRDFVLAHPSATLTIASAVERAAVSDVVAGFSSRGPSILEGLKPDVAAPGVSIYSAAIKTGPSTEVVDPSGFLAVSGTSQATPHVAGSAALIKQLNPSMTPEQIKSALISSATLDVFTGTDQATRSGVLATGGGRVDLARAGSVAATFSPPSLSFGIRKLKKFDVEGSIDLKITSQIDGQNNFTVSVQQLDRGDGVNVAASAGSVSLARGQTETVTITNTAIVGSQRRDYTGYIMVSGGGQTLHVPYWVRFVKKKQ